MSCCEVSIVWFFLCTFYCCLLYNYKTSSQKPTPIHILNRSIIFHKKIYFSQVGHPTFSSHWLFINYIYTHTHKKYMLIKWDRLFNFLFIDETYSSCDKYYPYKWPVNILFEIFLWCINGWSIIIWIQFMICVVRMGIMHITTSFIVFTWLRLNVTIHIVYL